MICLGAGILRLHGSSVGVAWVGFVIGFVIGFGDGGGVAVEYEFADTICEKVAGDNHMGFAAAAAAAVVGEDTLFAAGIRETVVAAT